jgi:hypothetical protein
MTSLNKDRFLKILALTESPNDAEALAAMRKATSMAREAGMSLGEAVGGKESDKAFSEGWQGGHSAGATLARREAEVARAEANRRIRELEAELEGYRDPLDWVRMADRARCCQFTKYRPATNKLTAEDKAELRRFAAEGGAQGQAQTLHVKERGMSDEHIGLTNGRSPDDVFPLEETIEALAQFIVQLPEHRREAEHDRRIDAIRKRLIDEGFPPEYAQAWRELVADGSLARWTDLEDEA